jgi:hypothetical protein
MAAWNTLLASRFSALTVAFLLTLGGCGGSDDGSTGVDAPSGTSPNSDPTAVINNRLTGSVGDGPIVNARIRVYANSGALLHTTTSGDDADYDLTVKTPGKNYPLTIHADQGTDLVTGLDPDFRLIGAVSSPSRRTTANLNPFSTLIFEAARMDGGINDATVGMARDAVMSRYSFGLDPAIIADPAGAQITDSNIHLIVKSSETLGEMIRRTRDALLATGLHIHGDDVVAALAADLIDGWIDGFGAIASSSRIAAVANVASAAVLIEAMSNQLMVYDINATAAMDRSIRQVRPSAPASANTSNVAIPAEAFEQARRALSAAYRISRDPVIAATIEVMASATPGALPADIIPKLPSGIHAALRKATTDTAFASDTAVDQVNYLARSSGGSAPGPSESETPAPTPPPDDPEPAPTPPPSTNTPPVISGSPNTTLVVGTSWSFTPTASDADGDTLSFQISGMPSWMTFSKSTGRLSGTPGSANIGSYPDIRISVSDGKETAHLQAFTLTVTEPQPSTGSATISWSAPTEREDGTPLTGLSTYRIYYSRNASQLDQVQNVSSGVTSYLIQNLEQGTWYFAVSAIDSQGIESQKSVVVSKTIN